MLLRKSRPLVSVWSEDRHQTVCIKMTWPWTWGWLGEVVDPTFYSAVGIVVYVVACQPLRNESPGCYWGKWGSSPPLLWMQLRVQAVWACSSVSVSKVASRGRSQTCCWPHHWAPWAASERARHFRVGDTQRAAVDLEGALVVEVGLLVALGAFSSNIGEFGWKYVVREQKGL